MKRGRPVSTEEKVHPRTVWHRARQFGLDPRSETPFGALAIQGYFPDYQLITAEKVVQIYRDCRRHIGMPGEVVSPSFEVGQGLSPIHEDDDERERAEAFLKAFCRVQDVLAKFPPAVRMAFNELCIHGRHCAVDLLPKVKDVLEQLAAALGYKAGRKKLDKSKAVND